MLKRILCILIVGITLSPSLYSQGNRAEQEIRELLDNFLYGASVGDMKAHDRFWAEDLIYTSSSGERYGKDLIMNGFEEGQTINEQPPVMYSAEDVVIRLYGNTAVLTFTLVADPQDDPNEPNSYYYNSGVLTRIGAQWKVINWQATAIPVVN